MDHIHEPSSNCLEPITLDGLYSTQLEDVKQLWEKEYGRIPTIPSSRRVAPAHALVQLLENYDLTGETALDLGCGNGRNAFYLSAKKLHVTAIDFSPTALALLEAERDGQEGSAAVSLVNHDIRDGLPLGSSTMDFVLDSYCLCHFLDDSERRDAMHEVYRVLKPGGKLIKIHLDSNDEYYIERLSERTNYGHTSYDPVNGLYKMHMSSDEYLKEIGSKFQLVKRKEVKFTDYVRGIAYDRSIFVCVSQKR